MSQDCADIGDEVPPLATLAHQLESAGLQVQGTERGEVIIRGPWLCVHLGDAAQAWQWWRDYERGGKEFSTWQAQFARAGWALQRDGRRFVASRWGQSRLLTTMEDLQAFARQVGVTVE